MSARWVPPALVAVCALALVTTVRTTSLEQGGDLGVAWSGLAGAIAAIALLLRRDGERPLGRAAAAWSAFLGLSALSALLSQRQWSAFAGEPTSMLGWGALVALTAIAGAGARWARPVEGLLGRFAWLLALAQATVALGQRALSDAAVLAGSLPNSTYLGEAMVLLLPWTVPFREECPAWERWARYGTVVLSIVALAARGSRVALIVAIAWAVWQLIAGFRGRRAVALGLSAALVAVALAAGFALARAETAGSLGVQALGYRPEMLRVAAVAMGERPLIGWGPDGFLAGGGSVTTPLSAAERRPLIFGAAATDPHNALAWIAVSTGLLGVALFCWFVIESGLSWRARQVAGRLSRPAVWAVAGCFVVLLTAPAVHHVLPLFALTLGVSLAVPATATRFFGREWDVGPRLRSVAASGALLICLVLVANGLTRAALEAAPYRPREPEVEVRLAGSSASAASLWRFDAHLAYLASLHAGFAADVQPGAGHEMRATDTIARAVELDRRNPFYALQQARTLWKAGAPPESTDAAFVETFARYPLYPLARAEYAAFLAQGGRYDEARRQIAISRLVDGFDTSQARLAALAAAESIISGAAK